MFAERNFIMKAELIERIFAETAYVRMGGSDEELRAAEYLKKICAESGFDAHIEDFEVDMATIKEAELLIDGKSIPCKGYLCAGSAEVEAPLYYLTSDDRYSLSLCSGKIVLFDGYLRGKTYKNLIENGALGFTSDYPDICGQILDKIGARKLKK